MSKSVMITCEFPGCKAENSHKGYLSHWVRLHPGLPPLHAGILAEHEACTSPAERRAVREKYGKTEAQIQKLRHIHKKYPGGNGLPTTELSLARTVHDALPLDLPSSPSGFGEPSMRDAIGYLEMHREIYDRIIGDLRKLVRR